MKNILLLSRYGDLGASSRLRSYQYLQHLTKHDIIVKRASFFDDRYITSRYNQKLVKSDILKSYLLRIMTMLSASKYDLIWIEYEALPWLPIAFETVLLPSTVPILIDYDDAIFHRYDRHTSPLVRKLLGNKIKSLMRRADVVVVGNEYIAAYAKNAGALNIEYLPTVVDTDKYAIVNVKETRVVNIGWIGSPYTQSYLESIFPILKKISEIRKIKVSLVGAQHFDLNGTPVDFLEWSEELEVQYINEFDIGIMPLPDEPFERGKCGYKLIQYMACAKPVVASPVGVNCKIVEHGQNGFLASSEEEWTNYLLKLIDNYCLRLKMGMVGRKKVESEYSLSDAAGTLCRIIEDHT